MRRTPLARFEASNLGQLVGRELYGALAPSRLQLNTKLPRVAHADSTTVTGRDTADEADDAPLAAIPVRTVRADCSPFSNGPSARLRAVLARHPEGLRFGPLISQAGVDRNTAGSVLSKMNDIERSGGRRHYLYRLIPFKENP